MAEYVLFGGTTEGRELASVLERSGKTVLVCVATEYGEQLLTPTDHVRVHTGRLDEAGIGALLRQEQPRKVIDATHPYALAVSRILKQVCAAAEIPYVRVLRETVPESGCLRFRNMDELTAWLNETPGTVFSTLGVKEAAALQAVENYQERIYLRILPSLESLELAKQAGFPMKHLICMQGPFSRELNEAMFREVDAKIMLTKESGAAGGFPEKLEAARSCGMTVALLPRPGVEEGLTMGQLAKQIEEGQL